MIARKKPQNPLRSSCETPTETLAESLTKTQNSKPQTLNHYGNPKSLNLSPLVGAGSEFPLPAGVPARAEPKAGPPGRRQVLRVWIFSGLGF